MSRKSENLPKWRVTRITAKGSDVCDVRAKNAEEAKKRAIKEHLIEPFWQDQLLVYRVA